VNSIEYPIKAIKQETSECMQTAATQMISYFDTSITVNEVLRTVPVYEENGEKIGTSPGHLATYFTQKGYHTTSYIFDTELFDRTWEGLTSEQVVKELQERQAYIPDSSWLAKYHRILVDGWKLYAESGGNFSFTPLSVALLRQLLNVGPYLLMVNSTYLNQEAKQLYDKGDDRFNPDPIRGRSLTHATTCAGYKEGNFLIVDPDPPRGIEQHRWVQQDHLIASIMAAQTESDNLLLSISQ
jgi:hypothetical protein